MSEDPSSPSPAFYDELWRRKLDEGDAEATLSPREELALSRLTGGDSFLDIGCGHGRLCAAAADRFQRVCGCDISEEALAAARERGVETCLLLSENEGLPYPDRSFDAVCALDVIEHLFDPPSWLAQVARVMKPGGQLLLATPNFRKAKNLVTLGLKGRFPKTSSDRCGWDGGHLAYFTRKDLEELLRGAGLVPLASLGIYDLKRQRTLKRFTRRLLGAKLAREFLASGLLVEARA